MKENLLSWRAPTSGVGGGIPLTFMHSLFSKPVVPVVPFVKDPDIEDDLAGFVAP